MKKPQEPAPEKDSGGGVGGVAALGQALPRQGGGHKWGTLGGRMTDSSLQCGEVGTSVRSGWPRVGLLNTAAGHMHPRNILGFCAGEPENA